MDCREKRLLKANPKNEHDEECFKWAVIAALHHEKIEKDVQRISKLKPYVGLYNWDGLEFLVAKEAIGKFENNNIDFAISVLYITGKNINIQRKSKYHNRK